METASAFGYSKVIPFCLTLTNNQRFSLRPFNKHLQAQFPIKNCENQKSLTPIQTHLKCSLTSIPNYRSQFYLPKSHFLQSVKCSYSSDTTSSELQDPFALNFKILPLDSIKATLSRLTPIDICKWSLVFSIALAAVKWCANLLFNPFFWMYFSWTWNFWPLYVAVGVTVYGVHCIRKHLRGEANVVEQFAAVTSTFSWLTLIPIAHFNGYLEGWPVVFFLVYHYFFFLDASVRRLFYGDLYPRQHDPKWDFTRPDWQRFLFCAGVMVAHWLGACEGPELHMVPGGRSNFWIWGLIMLAIFTQYHSTVFLAKYSENVVVPTAVVKFGPYRWVRHPIYASIMLLFVTYFAALRAPFSGLFIAALCFMYYEPKARAEEALMIETFGAEYTEYMKRVRNKFIPFVY